MAKLQSKQSLSLSPPSHLHQKSSPQSPLLVMEGRRRRGLPALSSSPVLLIVAIVTASVVLAPVLGRFVVEKNSIAVLEPPDYRAKHDSAIGNFGVPDYGGSMIGVVLYPGKNAQGCNEFDTTFKSKSRRPVFLLLDRGECYFAKKVWHAQKAGAAAVLITDNVDETLITMDSPAENTDSEGFIDKITIPSSLIQKSFGESLKKAVKGDPEVVVKMDWSESMPNPDKRVEYEFWTNSNDECGARCDEQMNFVKNFKGHAQILERRGFVQFTPHYITWYCPQIFIHTRQCKSQCINHGRYCAPDPEKDFGKGYEGKDIVIENLRQLCVHRVGNATNRPWVWWDFVTDFHIRCSMKSKKYSTECAEEVVKSLGLPLDKVKECMGDPNADTENAVLKYEQEVQVGKGSRGDVTILPTLVINDVQYRGLLERTAVLKAICAGFRESTEPSVCLSSDIETNECLHNNGGCWRDVKSNVTACKDTFRGRVCECPVVHGVRYAGDGYKSCIPVGPARCSINNGGCWSETRNGLTLSACSDFDLKGCQCPFGFRGDGHTCEDVDECKERSACQCDGCSCKNRWGGFDCTCKGNLLYLSSEDTCIARSSSKFAWFLTLLVLFCLVCASVAGYIFYKYRLRSYMDSEIMAIMSQYMPIDNQQNEAQPLRESSTA